MVLLLVLLMTALPVRPLMAGTGAGGEARTGYVPLFSVYGQQAVIDGARLYYVTQRLLVTYDLDGQRELGRMDVGHEANVLTLLDGELYLLDGRNGRVVTFDVSGNLPVQTRKTFIPGYAGSQQAWEQGPLVRLDGQRLLTMARGEIFLFNEQSGQVEWSYDAGEWANNRFVVMDGYVFFTLQYSKLQAVKIGGGLEFEATIGSWPPVVDDAGADGPALLYVAEGSHRVDRLSFKQGGQAVTETWLQADSPTGIVTNLPLHAGHLYYSDNGRMMSCDLMSKQRISHGTRVIGQPLWHADGADAYRMSYMNGVQEVHDGWVTFGTQLPESVELVATDENGFVLRAALRDMLWVFGKARESMPARELRYGESHMLMLRHAEEGGPVSLNVSVELDNPALYADVQVFTLDWAGDWQLWDNAEVLAGEPGHAVYEKSLPATDLLVMITAGTKEEEYDAAVLAEHPEWAEPLLYQLDVGPGVELGAGEIPQLQLTEPWPMLELWGQDGAVDEIEVRLQTEPWTWVYLMNGDLPVKADGNGQVTQTVPLLEGLLTPIQAVAGTGDHVALVTLPVYRHWVLRRPGEGALLSRSPAINVPVPDASRIDLEYSQLLVGEREIPLYVDVKGNRLYGVPDWSLPTGTVELTLVLAGKAEAGTGGGSAVGEPVLLDALTWQQEIVGRRVGELWIGEKSAAINGAAVMLEAAPYIHVQSSSTMLPMRFLADVMGAQIAWNQSTRQVTFKLDGKTVVLTVGNHTATVDGFAKVMPTAPAIVNGRTFLPLRFVLENLGANVHWDNALRKVTIQAY